MRRILFALVLSISFPFASAEDAKRPLNDPPIEQLPSDPKLAKIVFVAGSNYFKPGEHEYVGGCAVLMDLIRQTPGTFPVLAIDWPKKPETFAGAKSIVFLLDGGDKHAFLKDNRFAEIQKLADAGVGLVQLHQVGDYPKDFGDRARALGGAAWEKGYSARAHWVHEFKEFPDHPIFHGVKSFKVDDGWLTKMRFTKDMKGVTPLLRTSNPKTPTKKEDREDIVGWAYERANGRSFTFTGAHLHASFAEEGYRRFLTNGILWTANVEVPKEGAKVELDAAKLGEYLKKK
jgi:type 1 glutamine amidotransferase